MTARRKTEKADEPAKPAAKRTTSAKSTKPAAKRAAADKAPAAKPRAAARRGVPAAVKKHIDDMVKIVRSPDLPSHIDSPALSQKMFDAQNYVDAQADPEEKVTATDDAVTLVEAKLATEAGQWVSGSFMAVDPNADSDFRTNPVVDVICIDGPWSWVGLNVRSRKGRKFCTAIEPTLNLACARISGHDGAHVSIDPAIAVKIEGPLAADTEV